MTNRHQITTEIPLITTVRIPISGYHIIKMLGDGYFLKLWKTGERDDEIALSQGQALKPG